MGHRDSDDTELSDTPSPVPAHLPFYTAGSQSPALKKLILKDEGMEVQREALKF